MNVKSLFLIGFFVLAWCCVANAENNSETEKPLNVKIMTFNIRYDNALDGENRWSNRRKPAAEAIRRFDGDFINLQEALPGQIADLRKLLPDDYRFIGRSRNADAEHGEAVPIFYRSGRWQLDEKEHGTFWFSDAPDQPGSKSWGNSHPRIATWARFIEKKTGRGVYVFNTHLDNASEPSRQKSAAMLARRIVDRKNQEPALLTGDFNAKESSRPLAYLTGRDSKSPVALIETYRAVHPDEKHASTFHDFHGGVDGQKIDYILASPGAKVRASEILRDHQGNVYLSDHYPVTAEVRFD